MFSVQLWESISPVSQPRTRATVRIQAMVISTFNPITPRSLGREGYRSSGRSCRPELSTGPSTLWTTAIGPDR